MAISKGRQRSILRGVNKSRGMSRRMGRPRMGRGYYSNPFAGIAFIIILLIALVGSVYIGLLDIISGSLLFLGLLLSYIGIKLFRISLILVGILFLFIGIFWLSNMGGFMVV